ncbi:MAG: DUF4388 domain-containing protein, partial [Deltaproteobacteria bacterium]|nr:DUF4388 domain-containing protein [Deltaproteobacteria bacterium]
MTLFSRDYLTIIRNKITDLRDGDGPQAPTLSDIFLSNHPSQSRFAESYRVLRTNIHFSFMEKEFRTLLVTSATEREGKTGTVANLSYTMAQAGKRVLMIDADLRKQRLSSIIPRDGSVGLTGLLSDTFSTDLTSGSLGEFGLGDLFWLLSFQKKTGFLHLAENGEEIDIYFRHGEPVDIDWRTRPKGLRLVTLLLRNKLLTKEQASQAVVRKRDTAQKIGFILVNMGFVKAEDLSGFINLQMIEAVRVALQCNSGKFAFKDLPESYFDRPSFNPLDVYRLYQQVVVGEEEIPYLQKKIQAAIMTSDTPNLFVLPSGRQPPNPTELLLSDRMSFLLSFLNRRFDRLVLDSPPILPASDAVVLAPLTDGVLLTVKVGHVNRKAAWKAVE